MTGVDEQHSTGDIWRKQVILVYVKCQLIRITEGRNYTSSAEMDDCGEEGPPVAFSKALSHSVSGGPDHCGEAGQCCL